MSINDVFIKSAKAGLQIMTIIDKKRGLMPAGCNGPYLDIESPLRNSAHWLLTFSVAYLLSEDEAFKTGAYRLYHFLAEPLEYKIDYGLVHRQKAPKDWCNGVIGPAWVAEGLIIFSKVFSEKAAMSQAKKLLDQNPFDHNFAAWKRMDPVQGLLGIDWTYNHQSWFACILAEIDGKDKKDILHFLDVSAESALNIKSNGEFIHHMQNRPEKPAKAKPGLKGKIKGFIGKIIRKFIGKKRDVATFARKVDHEERDTGYHIYLLHSIARLKILFPAHKLWEKEWILNAVRYSASEGFFKVLKQNRYSYKYNGPGLEYYVIALAFKKEVPEVVEQNKKFFQEQVDQTLNQETSLFTRNTYDPVTLAARLYELAVGLYYEKISG